MSWTEQRALSSPRDRPEDAILAPKSLFGIAVGLGCGLAVVVALSAVDGTLRLTQGTHVVVAALLGWWLRGRYEAHQQSQDEASVQPPAPVPPVATRPVRQASRLLVAGATDGVLHRNGRRDPQLGQMVLVEAGSPA